MARSILKDHLSQHRKYLILIIAVLFGVTVLASTNIFDLIKANRIDVDNVRIDGNTISTTNSNGDLTLDLNGTGSVILTDLTATTVPYLDGSKKLTSSAATPTQLGYLANASANLCGISQSCTLTNKVLTGNTAANLISGSGTLTLNTSGTVTLPNSTDTLVGKDTTDTFTNKTFNADGTGNSITNIENADIKAAAAIAVNKLAALTASRAVVTDGSGFITQATTTSTEIGFVNGVTSSLCGINQSCTLTNKTLTTPVIGGDSFTMTGSTSGTVSVKVQAAAGTFNFNLPTTAGTSGQVLTSAGGGASAMTWSSALTNPMTTTGDIIYSSSGTGTASRLAIGSTDQVLTVAAGIPSWATQSIMSSGTDRVERASINCDASPVVNSQSGSWLSSVTRNATGDCTVNITGSKFSAAPICQALPAWGSGGYGFVTLVTTTTTTIQIQTRNSAGTASDIDYHLICQGAR